MVVRRIIVATDVVVSLIAALALLMLLDSGITLFFDAFGEFGSVPCNCENLQERLETVDWTGTGMGMRFRPLVIEELGPPVPFDAYVLTGESLSDAPGESIIRRLEATPLLSRIPPPIPNRWDFAYQVDETVLRVDDRIGRLTLHATNDVDAAIVALDRIAANLGDAQRPAKPTPWIRDRIISTFENASVPSLVLVSVMWLGLRVTGVVRLATPSNGSRNS